MTAFSRRTLLTLGFVAGTGVAVTACAPQAESSAPSVSGIEASGTAITHVHAITRDAATGVILLATHEGLFRLQNRELTRVGPVVDLMGFTIAEDGRYLASGHPGPGLELPEPLGLVESTDGGETWSVLSRGGESDFHALAAGPDRVLGFDGQLRTSADGRTWKTTSIPSAPAALAIAPGTGTVLATTKDGVLRSDDDGASWATLDTPQLMSLAAWADEKTIVGAGIDGRLLTSRDTGDTWTTSDQPVGEVTALGAHRTEDGQIEALLIADDQVLRTVDAGATTQRLL